MSEIKIEAVYETSARRVVEKMDKLEERGNYFVYWTSRKLQEKLE